MRRARTASLQLRSSGAPPSRLPNSAHISEAFKPATFVGRMLMYAGQRTAILKPGARCFSRIYPLGKLRAPSTSNH